MFNNSLEKSISLLLYLCKIRFPKYSAHIFPIFVIIQRIKKTQYDLQYLTLPLKVIPIPNQLYNLLIRDEVIKSEHVLFVTDSVFKRYMTRENLNLINFSFITSKSEPSPDIKSNNSIASKILNKPNSTTLFHLLPIRTSKFNAVYMMENTYSNLIEKFKMENKRNCLFSKLQKTTDQQSLPQIATKANIFLINAPYDLSSDVIDFIISKYFEQPRLIFRNHTYLISLDEELLGNNFYTDNYHIFSNLKKLYFKCVNIESQGNNFELYGIVLKSLTNLHQMTSINYFVPNQMFDCMSFVANYPKGLQKYFNELKSSIMPFLKSSNSKSSPSQEESNEILIKRGIYPLFMMQGERGSGKFEVVQAVADNLGIQLFNGDCAEIISSISAQTESKLTTVLSKSNVCEPLIICLQNFENFGLDNEGNVDLRIASAFQTEIQKLFTKKHNHSIIVIAISNAKTIKPKIGSMFLEIIKIPILSTPERVAILQWLYMKEKFRTYVLSKQKRDSIMLYKNFRSLRIEGMLVKIAEECHGFMYGDLKLLFQNSFRTMEEENDPITYEHLIANLKEMQNSFSDSLGAPKVPKVLWSEIGGLAQLKTEIQNSIGLPLKHKHLMGNMRRSGILLYGPPGTGKTMIAKAVATECKMNFLSVQGPELLNMYVGQSEQNVREVFDRARAASPCVIFLDELDSLAPNRGVAGDSGGVMDRVVSQLLSEMDGMSNDPDKQIFILAATNRPDLIDPALLRPGRFDKLIYAGPSTTVEAKQAILQTITSKFNLSKDLSIAKIAELLVNDMTGADLYSICSNAWLSAVRRTIKSSMKKEKSKSSELKPDTVIVSLDDFQTAIKKFIPSVSKSDLLYFNELKSQYS